MNNEYRKIKKAYPNTILFFNWCEFYEAYYRDAIITSRELSLVPHRIRNMPMTCIPCHEAERQFGILIDKGYKLAICDPA